MNDQYTKERPSAIILYNGSKEICEWVSNGLFGESSGFDNAVGIGVCRGTDIVAGVVYNNMTRVGLLPHCIEMSIFSVDTSWATRHTLKALFSFPFVQLRLKRVQALCSAQNEGNMDFLERLGFFKEGYHPCAYADGGDAVSFGMLNNQCKWL